MSQTTDSAKSTYSCSVGIGGVIAAGLSYHVNASILWAILHFLLGWIYVVYYLFSHTGILNWLDKLGR